MDSDGGDGDGDGEEPTNVETRSAAPTVAAKRSAQGAEPGPTQTSQRQASTLTPDDAMRADEVLRNRLFLKIAASLAAMMAVSTMFLSNTMHRRWVVGASCLVVVVTALVFQRLFRDEKQFTQRRWLTASFIMMAASCVGVYYIGVFSPAPMVGTLGMYFLCLGSSPSVAVIAYIVGGVLHFVAALGFALRLVPDPGVFTGDAVSTRDMLVAAAMVQIVYFLTFVLARGSRRATRQTVARLHEALQQVQKREALLAEAHQELDRALKAGVAGRYTERRFGPYTLHEVIGRGAMSEVYRAASHLGGAAVKVLQRGLVVDPAQVQRFLREAEIVSALKSPNVVRVHSYGGFGESGAVMHDGDNPPYIAMELLAGHDLAWHLRQKRKLPSGDVLELCAQIAGALAEAERAEIVHRDLKPQNVFCHQPGNDTPPVWKVLDFGVSKLIGSSGTLTGGAIVGTPGYMAPEQARGDEDVGPAADVFALAAIAYRALTGRPAFAGKDMPRVLFDVCYVQPARPGRHAEVSEDVERALALGLAKKVPDRLSSAVAFAEALSAAFAERLDPRLRQRADALLLHQPWDSRPAG